MKKIINKTQQKIYAIWRKAKQHISSFVGGQFNKRQADVDYLHFLSSTGRHNNAIEILTSKHYNDEERFNQLTDWLNRCVEETNELNKKYGQEHYSQAELNDKFKIRRDNGNFHFGLTK